MTHRITSGFADRLRRAIPFGLGQTLEIRDRFEHDMFDTVHNELRDAFAVFDYKCFVG